LFWSAIHATAPNKYAEMLSKIQDADGISEINTLMKPNGELE
jgi:hypothetical protein